MLDPRLLRTDLDKVAKQLSRRGIEVDTGTLSALEEKRKVIQTRTQQLQNERNIRSKAIGQAKTKGEDTAPLLAAVADLGDLLKQAEKELEAVQSELADYLFGIPNIPHDSVPDGDGEQDNIEIRRWGQPPAFKFDPKDHVDLGTALGLMDFEAAGKITGARFAVMYGVLAQMHRALIHFMLDLHTQEHGYTETYVPYMVNADSLRGTGQLPKFESDLFALKGDQHYYLIPTAEVPVTNLMRDTIVEAATLPRKYGRRGNRRHTKSLVAAPGHEL